MEKPSKKEENECGCVYGEGCGCRVGDYNDGLDAMSTWIEGQLPTVEDIAKEMCNADHPELDLRNEKIPEYSGYWHYAQAIHALLTSKINKQQQGLGREYGN